MPAKKLDVGKSIERERDEPKLSGTQAEKSIKEEVEGEKVTEEQSFEIKLKPKPILETRGPIIENIELGMTPDEVIKVAGKPDSIIEWYTGNLKFNYGKVWIVIENGVVSCLVHDKYFQKYWGRSNYQVRNPEALIK